MSSRPLSRRGGSLDRTSASSQEETPPLLALAAGKTNKEIAETLGISAKTAGHYVQHILGKTGVRTRSAATVWAFERHLAQSA